VIETGIVAEVSADTVVIALKESGACFGCANQDCRSNRRVLTVENPRRIPLKLGQEVRAEISASSSLKQALGALLPPALGFIAGYIGTGLFFPPARGEPVQAVGGAVLLFLTALAVYFIRKRLPPKHSGVLYYK
jgi:sigma-E factor negative regulatory protein RseC